MSRIVVSLFGGPTVEVGEKSTSLSRYQAYLIAAVFGHGQRGVSRGHLARLLWHPADEATGRRRLSQLLYKLANQTLGRQVIGSQGDHLTGLNGAVECDLDAFRRCLDENRIAAAAEYLGAGFLSGLPEPPTREFDEWASGRALALRALVRDKAAALWAEAEPQGRWRLAKVAAEAMLRLDPLDERSLRRVLWAGAMGGRVNEAEAVYRTFAERAATIRPGPWTPETETSQLFERIRSLSDSAPEGGLVVRDPEPDAPLCGRDEELGRLTRILSTQGDAAPVAVVVSGEGGIGKTRLITEALIPTRLQGIRVLQGRSSAFEQEIPLNPLLEALDDPAVELALSRLENPWRTVMLSLMPQFHHGDEPLPDLGYIQPGSIPRRLYEAFHRLLIEVVKDGPVCLFIDDIHWADQTTLTVLEFLRRRWDTGGLVMVMAVRPETLGPGSPVAQFLVEVEASGRSDRFDLEELSQADARRLISSVADRSLPDMTISEIGALGGHNPFFLIELTLEHVAGRLEASGDRTDAIPVPLSIRQLFGRRLGNLSKASAKVCSILAVANRPLTLRDLKRLGRSSLEVVLGCVEELTRLRLAKCHDNTVSVRHTLVRECVYWELSEARRANIHEGIARHLISSRDVVPVDDVVLHFDKGGVRDLALRYALEAAARAEEAGAVPEALKYLQVARRNADAVDEGIEILGRLAELHHLAQNYREAAALLSTVVERLNQRGRTEEGLSAEVRRVDSVSRFQGLPLADFVAELRRIKSAARKERFWAVVAEALDVELHLHDRALDQPAVDGVFREAAECIEEGDAIAQVRALSSLAINIYYGSPAAGLSAAREAVSKASEANLVSELPRALNRLLLVLIYQGRFETDEGLAAMRRATDVATRSGDLFFRFNLQLNQGVWFLDTGRLDFADAALGKAAAVVERTGASWPQVTLALNRGELFAARGDYHRARAEYERCDELVTGNMPSWTRYLIDAGIGMCALEGGDLGEARRREAAVLYEPPRWYFDPSIVVLFRSRILQRRQRLQEAAELVGRNCAKIEGRMVPPWIRLKLEEAKLRREWDPKGSALAVSEATRVTQDLGLPGV